MKIIEKTTTIGFLSIAILLFTACTEQAAINSQSQNKPAEYSAYQMAGSNVSNRAITESEFSQTVYPILVTSCDGCHSTSAALSAAPFFADVDPLLAFNELYSNGKVDLLNPANSRIVQKLTEEQHQCWTTDCAADAAVIQAAIQEWTSLINVGQDVYVQLCAECHANDGNGTAGYIGLTRPMALPELATKIEKDMPFGNPTACVGECALNISQYIFDNFNATNTILAADPLRGLPEGQAQIALMCDALNAGTGQNVIRDTFCGASVPIIQSLTDLQSALGLAFVDRTATSRRDNGRHGNPSFTLSGHSSSLVARFVSAINPRALIFTPPVRINGNRVANPGFIAMGFVRGDQFAEIVVSDRVTGDLSFFLVTFKQACNLSNSCTPGDLLTPAIESNWVEYTVYSQTDLQNTILDCLQCHQVGGPGTASILRMQELRNPWTHFFRNNRRGGVALIDDFVAAHGTAEDYAGIPAPLINASDPAKLEDLVRGNGFRQPNEFRSRRIEAQVNNTPGQPVNNDIPGTSTTWQRLYNSTVMGESIPVPYHDVKVTDSAKLTEMTGAYQAYLSGTLAQSDLPDIRQVFIENKLPDIGFRVMAGLDGQQIITQACTQCHNSSLNQNISRARFNVDLNSMSDTQGGILTGISRDAEIGLAIARLQLAPEDVRKMPPEQFKTLSADEINLATSYLCSQMTVRGNQCLNIPAFIATPLALPATGTGTGAGFFW